LVENKVFSQFRGWGAKSQKPKAKSQKRKKKKEKRLTRAFLLLVCGLSSEGHFLF